MTRAARHWHKSANGAVVFGRINASNCLPNSHGISMMPVATDAKSKLVDAYVEHREH